MTEFPPRPELTLDQNIFAVFCINESAYGQHTKQGDQPLAMAAPANTAFLANKTHRRGLNPSLLVRAVAGRCATGKLIIFDARDAMGKTSE